MFWRNLYLGIFFIPLLINPFGADVFEIPKQAFLMLWLAGSILVTGVLLLRGKLTIWYHAKIFVFLFLWLLSLLISTLLSPAPWESFFGSAERMQGLLSVILYGIVFLFCFQIFKESRYQRAFFHLIIGIGVLLSAYALLQYFNLDPLDLADITDASGRAYATLGHPNFLGQFLIFPIITLLLSVISISDSSIRLMTASVGMTKRGCHSEAPSLSFRANPLLAGESRNPFLRRSDSSIRLMTASVGMTMGGLLTTLNRASMLGIGISLAIFFIFHYRFSWKKTLLSGLVLVLAGIIILTAGGLRSILSRTVLIKSSLPLVLENPLFGSGPETFAQTIQTSLLPELYETEHMFSLPDRVHNELLQTLLDQGLFGLSLYLFMIGFLFWLLVKKRLKTTAGIIAFYSIIAYLISVQFSFSMTSHWVMLAAMWAILLHETISVKKKTILVFHPLAKSGVVIAAALFSVALLVRGTSLVAADIFFDQSLQEIIADGKSDNLEKAVSWNPWSSRYLYHGISFLNVLQNPKEKISVMEEFLQKMKKLTGEKDAQFHVAAAEVEQIKGNFAAAERHFEKAASIAPNFPYVFLLWGDFALEQGRCAEAKLHFDHMVSLAPSYWNASTGEKVRIFKKGHGLFFNALKRLKECPSIPILNTGYWILDTCYPLKAKS